MAKPPIVVTISHRHSAAEAQRRIADGVAKAQKEFIGFMTADVKWTANHADIDVVALRQSVSAGIDVFDNSVRVELQLPWYLAPLQARIVSMLEQRGAKLLELAPPEKKT